MVALRGRQDGRHGAVVPPAGLAELGRQQGPLYDLYGLTVEQTGHEITQEDLGSDD